MWLAKITRDTLLSSPNLPAGGWHAGTIRFGVIAECGLFTLVSGWASGYWYPGFAESDVPVTVGWGGNGLRRIEPEHAMAIKQLTEEQVRTWTLEQKDRWWLDRKSVV